MEDVSKQINDLDTKIQLSNQATSDFREQLKTQFGEIDKTLKSLTALLTGNGEPAKGILIRLDRVEQAALSNKWVSRSALAAVFAGIFTALAAHFIK
jgi:hypothetical protein